MLATESKESKESQTAYIINALSEVSVKYMHSPDAQIITDKKPINGSMQYAYSNGRIKNDDNTDKMIQKNLKTCAGYDIFTAPDDAEEQYINVQDRVSEEDDYDI